MQTPRCVFQLTVSKCRSEVVHRYPLYIIISSSGSAPSSEHSCLHEWTLFWMILTMLTCCVETKFLQLKVKCNCVVTYALWLICMALPICWRIIDGCLKRCVNGLVMDRLCKMSEQSWGDLRLTCPNVLCLTSSLVICAVYWIWSIWQLGFLTKCYGKVTLTEKPRQTAALGRMRSKLHEWPAVYPAFAQQAARGN